MHIVLNSKLFSLQHIEDIFKSLLNSFIVIKSPLSEKRLIQNILKTCSVAQSCPTLRNPMDCGMPGLPVPHHLLKFAQVHAHCFSDAIQPSHPLMPSFPFVLNLSQRQGLFQWNLLFTSDDQNTGVSTSASVLPMTIQGWFPLRLTGLICAVQWTLRSLLQLHVWKHQLSVLCLLYGPTLTILCDH